MATAREIKRRIRSVKNIAQVTRALEAVSASKVRRAQAQALATRPYTTKAWELLVHLAAQPTLDEALHPLLTVREEVRHIGIILITSDRGLCGAFNYNILNKTVNFIKQRQKSSKLVTVGRRGRDLMWRWGYNIIAEFTNLPGRPGILDVSPIARVAIDAFLGEEVDEVYLAYTDFVTMLVRRPVIRRLLPLRPTRAGAETAAEYVEAQETAPVTEYIYEPSPQVILETVLPRFTELQVYHAVLESLASEHAARMIAMRNATENAQELVGDLILSYNKARQQAITREILDIAGGAEALRQMMSEMRV